MTVNRTTLLDLPLPVTGTESGTWGDTTNNGLTQYMDIAIAGMSNLTSANFTAGALTIETTEGDSSATNISATSAQYAGFRVSSLAVNSTITVGNTGTSPARSYRLINADATYSLTFKATGQTGVTLLPGQSAVVAFNGTDYVIVGVVGAGSTTDNTVPRFDGTTGEILQSSGITIDDSNNVSGVAQLNITTLDATNIEVTNIKAKDGTAAASIADSTGIITVSTQLQVDNINISTNTISSTDTNGNIEIAPNGTGDVYVTADTLRIGDSNANATLTTNGTGDLILNTNAGTNSGSITIADAANGDISLAPNGNGSVVITNTGTSNALRITQTGTGNALLVEDSANPDSSPFVIDANGNMVNGYTSVITVVSGTPRTQSIGGTPFSGLTYGDNATSGVLQLGRSRGTSAGTHAILQSGDGINQIRFEGSDGTNFIRAAAIGAEVDGTPGTNDMPGRLGFYTTADGASSPTERVRINSAGLTTVGYSAATGAALSTTVAAKLLSANTTYTDSATAASGTVTHGTINSFDNPAIAASNASVTYTSASTVYIDGAPTAGSNVTITNPYSLYVNGGTVYFGGTVSAADPIVQQTDIGTAPNEIPLNQYLGALAYENSEWVAPQVGSGITGGTGTICKTSFATQGGIKVMQILIDLTGLNSGGTAGDIIGVNGTSNPCYIAQIPSTYTVLGGRMTCLETPAGGDTDIDLYSATEGTGTEDTDITTLTETQIINAGTQSIGTVTYFAADPAANTYFYLVGQGTSNATYTAGRFLIEVFGA